jgi:hypothetical protein
VFNAATAGTNATITNNWAAQFNGNVDLGTNILRVGNGTVSNVAIQLGATANLGLYSSSANKIDFVTQGITRMSVNANGTVVMGSASTNVIGDNYLDYATNATGIRFTPTTITLSTGTGTPGTGVNYMRMFQTGNLTLQNGGTFTDNGYRLEVVGTSNFTDRVSVGNYATPSAQRIFTIGQDTAFISLGSLVGATNNAAMYLNTATPSISNYVFRSDGTTVFFNSPSASTSIIFQNGGNIFLRCYGNQNTSGVHSFNWTKPTYVNGTAGTSISGWFYDGTTRNWLTGNIATQSEIVWGATTYSFVGASTITNAYGNVFNAPIAGTNCTITNNWAALFNGGVNITSSLNVGNYASPSAQRAFTVGQNTSYTSIGSMVGATGSSAIYMNVATPSAVNYVLRSSGSNVFLNSPSASDSLILSTGGVANRFVITGTFGGASFNAFALLGASNTGQTASTAVAGWNYQSFSRQWATGNITTQSENVWGATTYSFVAASTITTAYGNVFNAPDAGLNATITNNFSALFNGRIQLTNGVQFTGVPTGLSDVNTLYGNNSNTTIALIAGSTPNTDNNTSGGFFLLRGNTYSALSGQRGWTIISSGTVSSPTGKEGSISMFTAGNSEKFRLFPNGNIVIQNGGTFTDNGFRLDVNGTGRFQNTLRVTNNLIAGFNTTPRTGTISDGVTSVLGNLQNFTTNYHSGEVLYSEVSGEALNFGQLCYRDRFGKWSKAIGDIADSPAYNMLGICLHTVGATDTAISILTKGYVETTYIVGGNTGDPLYMSSSTAGSINNAAPTSAGNVIRLVGNVFWDSSSQTNGKWILSFSPDNTWIEL